MSIFGMCIIDSWLTFTNCIDSSKIQKEFYTLLSQELIDNGCDNDVPIQRHACWRHNNSVYGEYCEQIANFGPHITATKRKRKIVSSRVTNHLSLGYCMICNKNTIYLYLQCSEDKAVNLPDAMIRETWIYYTNADRPCLINHLIEHD